jgi:hypothetical protein
MTWLDAAPAITVLVLVLIFMRRLDRSFERARLEHERLERELNERARARTVVVESEAAEGVHVRAPAVRPDDYPADRP